MKLSAGLLVYRFRNNTLEVLLVHPGGPFYARKDEGVWTIPKGEYNMAEDPLSVALREFNEETGNTIQSKEFIELETIKTRGGKKITCWAVAGDFEQPFISSNLFEMEWPPRSGKRQSFPETDNAAWFTLESAMQKINSSQLPLLHQLQSLQPRLPR